MGNWLARGIETIDKKVAPDSNEQKSTFVDTGFKYAPLAFLFALDQQGIETKNSFKKQLGQILVGELILNAAVTPLKNIVNRERPNGEQKSFPSRHTGSCFLYAELVRNELKEYHPSVAFVGHALSVTTAALRVYHKKHWLSDVVTGAVFGIISFKLTDKFFEKLNRSSIEKRKKSLP